MGVFTFTHENMSSVPPARLFKALIVDSHKLILRLWPQAIKSIDILQGDRGPGTIKQINFVEGSQLGNMKNRVDELNEETFMHKHTMIDLKEKFESIAYEVKFEPTPNGGSKNKMTSTYYTKGDIELKEEDIKAGKESLGNVQGRRSVPSPISRRLCLKKTSRDLSMDLGHFPSISAHGILCLVSKPLLGSSCDRHLSLDGNKRT